MNILKDLFTDFSTFSRYAPGVETNMTLDDLQPSGLTACKRIEAVVSPPVLRAIMQMDTEEPLIEALRSAVANITMASQLIFDSINRRKKEVNVYKYEFEAMHRSYIENYCNALDTMLQLLMEEPSAPLEPKTSSPTALWRKTRYFALLSQCEVKTMAHFDMLYPIDGSYLFFFRTVPLQREIIDELMGVYFAKLTPDNTDRLRPMLLLALIKKTVAKALRRFDMLEFPPTIRNLFDENHASRAGNNEYQSAMALADRLDSEALELLTTADALLTTEPAADFCSNAAYNRSDDNIMMLP